MKKSVLIIFGNLAAHVLIAFVTANRIYTSSFPSGQGQIFWFSRETYLTIFGFSFILVSCFLAFILRKQYLPQMLISILLSCGVWILSGNIMTKRLAARNAQELRTSQDNWENITKTETLEYARKMNFQSFSWNSAHATCFAKDRNGSEHVFYVNQNSIWVICNVKRPEITDTLSWLQLTVNKASFYLNVDALEAYKLGIDSGHYSFYADREKSVNLEIAPIRKGKRFLSLRGSACRETEGNCMKFQGNLSLHLSDQVDRIP